MARTYGERGVYLVSCSELTGHGEKRWSLEMFWEKAVKPLVHRDQEAWDDLADVDPFWSILSDPVKQFSRWNVEEFFATGEKEIASLLAEAGVLGYPRGMERALDFGCGVGRLTRSLAQRFQECYGVDISGKMIGHAQRLNDGVRNCRFLVNASEDLAFLPSDHFDLIYSNIVLQHIPGKRHIKNYISEFVRILARGGLLVFQLPSHIPFRNRIQMRARLYGFLRRWSLAPKFLYETVGLCPIRMNFIPEPDIVALLTACGGKVLQIKKAGIGKGAFQSCRYFVTKA